MTRPSGKFIARYLSFWWSDRLYRVYLVGNQMYFIRIGGQGGMWQAVGAQFGLAGMLAQLGLAEMLVQLGIAQRGEKKRKSLLERLDSQDPSELLYSHKHNFRSSTRDVVASRLDPPSVFASHGAHFGKWLLEVAGQKPMTFQFETLEEMQEAYSKLPTILGPMLVVNTKWDPIKGKFVNL